jgi:hypothetical protein
MLFPSAKGEEVEVSRGRTAIKHIRGKEKMKENGDTSLLVQPDDEDNAGSTIIISGSLKDRRKGKGPTQSEGTTKGTKRRPKEFPMSTRMLQSISSSPTTVSPPRWGKRLSRGSGDERISKRSKKERDLYVVLSLTCISCRMSPVLYLMGSIEQIPTIAHSYLRGRRRLL